MEPATALLDLLTYDLPLDEVSASVWHPLCSTGRRSLRGCSRLGRQLADSLITSATVQVTEAVAAGVRFGLRNTLWHQALSDRCNFLARLHQLTALHIDADSSADLLDILLRAGAATSGRITALSLHAPDLRASSTAIGLACPHLQQLRCGRDEGRDVSSLRGDADLYFLPLPGLQKLEVLNSAALGVDALRSISNITRLEHLCASVQWGVPDGVLMDWTRLTRLTHCELSMADTTFSQKLCTLDAAAPLLRLTQLRRLVLQSVRYGAAPDAAAVAAPPPPTAAVAEALSLLGGLVHLETLHLGRCFRVDAPALAALDRLTQLTALGLGLMRCAPVGRGGLLEGQGGHLPHLVSLTVNVELPSQLLATLAPLLPLPSLVHLHTTAFDAPGSLFSVQVAVCNDLDPAVRAARVAAECAALRQVAVHLAAAPHLRLPEVHVRMGVTHVVSRATLSLPQVVEGLQPLAGGITTLTLSGHYAPAPDSEVWQPLCASLWGLQRLHISGWNLGDGDPAFLAVHLPALQRLTLTRIWGVKETGWLGLAAAASRALVLCVEDCDFSLSAEVKARCQAEGERVHGMCHLTFDGRKESD